MIALAALLVPVTLQQWLTETGQTDLITLEPERVRAAKGTPGKSLADFDRMIVTIGGQRVIVPRTMVLVEETPPTASSDLSGYPKETLVLYLLSTLDANQWSAVRGNGITWNELRPEQRPAMEAILGPALRYERIITRPKYKVAETGTVDGANLKKVGLRLERTISMQVNLVDGGHSNFDHDNFNHGAEFLQRDDSERYDTSRKFGIDARKTVQNKLKSGDLDYTLPALEKPVSLGAATTIGQALIAIGKDTGLELHADVRVRDRALTGKLNGVPASALLKSIAMMVTGTYRMVGTAFVLTSDRVGLGARKIHYGLWSAEVQARNQEASDRFRKQLFAGKELSKADFADDDLAPTDALRKTIDANERMGAPSTYTRREDLTPALRAELDATAKSYSLQKWDTSRVQLWSSYGVGFTLPDHRKLRLESLYIASPRVMNARNQPTEPRPPFRGSNPKRAYSKEVPLLVRAEGPTDVQPILDAATHFGVAHIALETDDLPTLQAAAQAVAPKGIALTWAVNPWHLGAGTPARNIMGQTATEFLKDIAKRPIRSINPSHLPPPTLSDLPYLAEPGCWKATLAGLKLPLKEVLLLSPEPAGTFPSPYPERSHPDPITQAWMEFSYSPEQRLAFLRQESIDPIDIARREIWSWVDLRQPFFMDDALRPVESVYDGSDDTHPAMDILPKKWDEWRITRNEAAMRMMAEDFGRLGVPLRLTMRPSSIRSTPPQPTMIALWNAQKPLKDLLTPPSRPSQTDAGIIPWMFAGYAQGDKNLLEAKFRPDQLGTELGKVFLPAK